MLMHEVIQWLNSVKCGRVVTVLSSKDIHLIASIFINLKYVCMSSNERHFLLFFIVECY